MEKRTAEEFLARYRGHIGERPVLASAAAVRAVREEIFREAAEALDQDEYGRFVAEWLTEESGV